MRSRASLPAILAAVAFLLFLVPGMVGPYGPFIDELYYVSCAKRLAWGYVDHPPLAPFLLWLSRGVLGDGLLALRLPAAAAGALVVLGTGLLAARLGAGRFGQAMASGAALTAPVFQVLFGFYSMNAIELLLWLVLTWILVEIAFGAHPRAWIAFGIVAGLALMTKHTVVTFGLALGGALLLTPARRHLRTPWPWLGAALALLIAAPNILWQIAHGWPSLEFYRNAALNKNQPVGPVGVLLQQVQFMSPGTVPVTIAGLVFLLRRREGPDLRHLGWMFLILLGLLMVSGQSRPDRIGGIYPLLFAAGGAWLGRAATAHRRLAGIAAPVWLVAWGVLLAPIGLPLLPPERLAAYGAAIHAVPQLERGEGKRAALPQWFADRLGWQTLVDDVVAVRARLSADERERVVYFAPSYGQAGALDWLGADEGLAPVYSTHNTWYLWGPPAENPEVAIVIGSNETQMRQLFADVERAAEHRCGLCMPWRDGMPIWIGRRPLVRIADQWEDWKHFE